MFVNVSRIARDLAADVDGRAARRRARARDRRVRPAPTARPRSSPATFAVSVTMRCPLTRSYSPTIVAFSMRATSPSSGVAMPLGADRHDAQILERRHPRLRHLDLHLKRDAGPRVGPVVRRHEAAGRGGGGKRRPTWSTVTPSCPASWRSTLTWIAGVVERLAELQIAQRRRSARARRAPSPRTPGSPRSPGPSRRPPPASARRSS